MSVHVCTCRYMLLSEFAFLICTSFSIGASLTRSLTVKFFSIYGGQLISLLISDLIFLRSAKLIQKCPHFHLKCLHIKPSLKNIKIMNIFEKHSTGAKASFHSPRRVSGRRCFSSSFSFSSTYCSTTSSSWLSSNPYLCTAVSKSINQDVSLIVKQSVNRSIIKK